MEKSIPVSVLNPSPKITTHQSASQFLKRIIYRPPLHVLAIPSPTAHSTASLR